MSWDALPTFGPNIYCVEINSEKYPYILLSNTPDPKETVTPSLVNHDTPVLTWCTPLTNIWGKNKIIWLCMSYILILGLNFLSFIFHKQIHTPPTLELSAGRQDKVHGQCLRAVLGWHITLFASKITLYHEVSHT